MSHTVELLAVGTELLLGNIANTDAQFLSQELAALGLNVYYHSVVGDNPARLKEALRLAVSRADILITTGGLGPTCDDLTKQTIAEFFGKKLVYSEEDGRRIQAFFAQIGKSETMTENNLRQAYLPESCTIFHNDWGTAPGCAFCENGIHVLMLPGPPRECSAMFRACAVPYLRALSDAGIYSHNLRVFGMGESAVENTLRDLMLSLQNPTLAPYAKEGEVLLRLTAKAESAESAEAKMQPVLEEIRRRLGSVLYGMDIESLEELVSQKLRESKKTLAAAESCTGGLLAKRITDLPGASEIFLGGVTSYTNGVKEKLLGVSPALLREKGAVNPETALAMAQGVRRCLGADYGIGITGLAGPDGDGVHPVGTVYIALSCEAGNFVRETHLGAVRTAVRNRAVNHALDMLRRAMDDLPLLISET